MPAWTELGRPPWPGHASMAGVQRFAPARCLAARPAPSSQARSRACVFGAASMGLGAAAGVRRGPGHAGKTAALAWAWRCWRQQGSCWSRFWLDRQLKACAVPATGGQAGNTCGSPSLAAGAHPLLYMGIDSAAGAGVGAGEGGAVAGSEGAAAPASAQPEPAAGAQAHQGKQQVGCTEEICCLQLNRAICLGF